MPVDIFRDSFTEFTVLYYQDWNVTSLGVDTMLPNEDKHWNINNQDSQQVMVTVDLASTRMAEQGCQDQLQLILWAAEDPDQSYHSTWNKIDQVWADNSYYMSMNIDFGILEPGLYSVGILGADSNVPAQDFNMHAYSSSSPVHFFDENNNQLSTQ